MRANSRRKGTDAGGELLRHLRELRVDATRNLDQERDGGGDVLLPGWSVEAKRAKQASLGHWWDQAIEQAEVAELTPALAYRLDRRPWRVRVPIGTLAGIQAPVGELVWSAEISLAAFAHLTSNRSGRVAAEQQ